MNSDKTSNDRLIQSAWIHMIRTNGNKAAVIRNMKELHPLNPEDQISEAVYEAEARLKSQGVRGHDRIKPRDMKTTGYVDAKEHGKGKIAFEESVSIERMNEIIQNAVDELSEDVPADKLVEFCKIQLIRNNNLKEAMDWVGTEYTGVSYELIDKAGSIAESELQKDGDGISIDEIARFIRTQRRRQDKTDIRKIAMAEYPYTPDSKIDKVMNVTGVL